MASRALSKHHKAKESVAFWKTQLKGIYGPSEMLQVSPQLNGPPRRAVTAGANVKSMLPGHEDCIANEGVTSQRR